MAHVIAKGAREGGAQVDVKRVPEIVSEEAARRAQFKMLGRRKAWRLIFTLTQGARRPAHLRS
jgi:hypothetical protein